MSMRIMPILRVGSDNGSWIPSVKAGPGFFLRNATLQREYRKVRRLSEVQSPALVDGRILWADQLRIDAVENAAGQQNLTDQAGVAQLRLGFLREAAAEVAAPAARQARRERRALLQRARGGPE